jgi:hypothetical protein
MARGDAHMSIHMPTCLIHAHMLRTCLMHNEHAVYIRHEACGMRHESG